MDAEWMGALGRATGDRALFRDVSAWGRDALTDDLDALDEGFHVVVRTFEGQLVAARMTHVERHPDDLWAGARALSAVAATPGPDGARSGWRSSLTQAEYERAVETVREHIARGDVYQVNVCRTLSRAADLEGAMDMDSLFLGVLAHNPARHAARIDLDGTLDVVSASPELYLRRDGDVVASAPIKGTAATAEAMLPKDVTENVMITDLVRNDLQRVCRPGTVAVEGLLRTEQHPGLVHLVSTVVGRLEDGVRWRDILERTGPPGSVSGTPKRRALEVIDEVEHGPRGPYCGAIGWIDGDRGVAELAVGIRTFWADPDTGAGGRESSGPIRSRHLHFGVGAGITWDSQPAGEWDETELKARRLLAVAAGAIRKEEA